MAPTLCRRLCIHYPSFPLVLLSWSGCGQLGHQVWQPYQKVIERDCTGPPFLLSLAILIQTRVMTNKTIDLVAIKDAVKISLA